MGYIQTNRCTFLVAIIVGIIGICHTGVSAADSPETKTFTFVQLCDTQLGFGGYEHDLSAFKQAAKQINAMKPDFVVICAPHTPVTERLFGRAQMGAMKPTAYLINIGRGVVVQLDALTEALQTSGIAGAALDVFEQEPLPADHPLWDLDNAILTPHVSDTGPYVPERQMEIFLENARRFVAGQPLATVVDKAQWC